ncbi:5-oxoprolinase/urea amidolyase family protein [Thioalkalivibrio sp. HK1]|uniref:5-oxoprolinase/urea amidolyase family protein n=1 Tax=Thioalkalivibrio sp. HK1 TaxID=1469245 RepID=UPI0018CC5D47|nr:5-oxoprolinase/urea amidolyase family protein [Thioalkalivibrio sp. HK1]
MTTVQDLGRYGAQGMGIPISGALDPISLRLANALVGNPQGAAGLELRFLGPKIRIEGGPIRIALVGTQTSIDILEPTPLRIPSGRSVTLADGQVFRIGGVADTSCCYLAISGRFDLPVLFGSMATFQTSGIGGVDGRAIQDADKIDLIVDTPPLGPDRMLMRSFEWNDQAPIRIVPGPQADYFTQAAFDTFASEAYEISRMSSRMALRLEGPPLTHAKGFNIPSDGVVNGSIQVPGNQMPIILMVDRQTTGGYPKIATVISADLPRLGRALPGQKLRFKAIEVDEAERIRRDMEARIQELTDDIGSVSPSIEDMNSVLMRKNLISGAVSASG